MALSYFFHDAPLTSGSSIVLDEDASKHIVQVLRMERGAALMLTNGKGEKASVLIADDHRKRCTVEVQSVEREEASGPNVTIAISMLKNAARFEWFLEKATEIGVREIIPLVCARTEKEKFRFDRMQQILISAMLQSQQSRLPRLYEPTGFAQVTAQERIGKRYIAHCLEEGNKKLPEGGSESLMLIGPEGDFTKEEIALAIQQGFEPVTLGTTRLRTETAGMVAATLLRILR